MISWPSLWIVAMKSRNLKSKKIIKKMKNQEISKENKIIMGVAGVLSLAVIAFAIFNVNSKDKILESTGPSLYDTFAQCLTDKGAIMYGAAWCSHCQAQKKAFGSSFKLIKYVECPDNTQLCIDKGIQGYPTWLLDGKVISEGFSEDRSMKELSEATLCPLP